MSFNLVVWKWTPTYDSAAKRRKLGVKYEDIMSAFARNEKHPGMAKCSFAGFEKEVLAQLGPEVVEGPYILERHACALVFNLPFSQVPLLVAKIGMMARKHGLTSAEM